jgi:hypothetical protein
MLIFGRTEGTLSDLRNSETWQITVRCVHTDCGHRRESVLFPTTKSVYRTSYRYSTSDMLKATVSNAVKLVFISAAQDVPWLEAKTSLTKTVLNKLGVKIIAMQNFVFHDYSSKFSTHTLKYIYYLLNLLLLRKSERSSVSLRRLFASRLITSCKIRAT